jgi:hypothetical protein
MVLYVEFGKPHMLHKSCNKVHLKGLKLMAAYIGVGLMSPGHCLSIDRCSYCVLQLLYH